MLPGQTPVPGPGRTVPSIDRMLGAPLAYEKRFRGVIFHVFLIGLVL